MKLKKRFLLNILLAIAGGFLIALLHQKGALTRAELGSRDCLFRSRGTLAYNPHIIIIEIDDDNISGVGRWPWKRTWHAAITRALTDLGAKSIYFDFILSESSSEEDDAIFEETIKSSKNVYLPFAFQGNSLDIKKVLLPLQRFSPFLKGSGAINVYPDIDGALRKIPLIFPGEEGINTHIALKIAMDYSGLKISEIGSDYLLLANSKEKIKIPLIEKDEMMINWTGKWRDTFRHYSFLDILAGYKDFLENKNPKINLNDFKDSICLVGVTSIGLHDIKPIPLEPEYPSIGVIANAISNLLNKNFLKNAPDGINIFLIYLLALMPAFLIFEEKPLRGTIFVLLIGGIYLSINFFLFKSGLMLNLTGPLSGLFVSYFTIETYNFIRTSVERKTFLRMSITDGLTGLYNIRYFKMLLETEIKFAESDASRKFSILMSDIDNFKHFNDTYGHQVGDLVLKEMASVLKKSVRSSDIAARYGGEEMIVLLRGSSLKDGLNIAEKIRANIENSLIRDKDNIYKVTISIGVATFESKDEADTIVKRADDGLYKAKADGRNRACSIKEPN